MNSVCLVGYLGAEPVKREIGGRTAVIFPLIVNDEVADANSPNGKRVKQYSHTVIAWDEVGDWIWLNPGIGDSMRVEGKLTSRRISGQKYLKTELVAYLALPANATQQQIEEARLAADITLNGLAF